MHRIPSSPRVAHICPEHPWTDNRVHYRECASLVERGYDVTLFAAESQVTGHDVGVEVVKLPRTRMRSRILTLLNARVVLTALRKRTDVFHFHDPEMVWTAPWLRLLGKKVIVDVHEDYPTRAWSHEGFSPVRRLIAAIVAHVETAIAWLFANHVIAATETISQRFRKGRVSVIHNYPPLRREEENAPPVTARSQSLVYVGLIEATRGANVMVDALSSDGFPTTWRLNLAGGISPALLDSLSTKPGWRQVDFSGQLPPTEARDLILHSRIGLVVLQATRAYMDSLPTKLYEYLAAGVPVIASDFPLWRAIIEENECGLLVDESSPEQLAEAVRRYDQDPNLLRVHSENARRVAVEKYNWEREAETLARVYQRVLNR